jgi:hypothetical protein
MAVASDLGWRGKRHGLGREIDGDVNAMIAALAALAKAATGSP